jgi:predicted N-acetyltransferase YhbS
MTDVRAFVSDFIDSHDTLHKHFNFLFNNYYNVLEKQLEHDDNDEQKQALQHVFQHVDAVRAVVAEAAQLNREFDTSATEITNKLYTETMRGMSVCGVCNSAGAFVMMPGMSAYCGECGSPVSNATLDELHEQLLALKLQHAEALAQIYARSTSLDAFTAFALSFPRRIEAAKVLTRLETFIAIASALADQDAQTEADEKKKKKAPQQQQQQQDNDDQEEVDLYERQSFMAYLWLPLRHIAKVSADIQGLAQVIELQDAAEQVASAVSRAKILNYLGTFRNECVCLDIYGAEKYGNFHSMSPDVRYLRSEVVYMLQGAENKANVVMMHLFFDALLWTTVRPDCKYLGHVALCEKKLEDGVQCVSRTMSGVDHMSGTPFKRTVDAIEVGGISFLPTDDTQQAEWLNIVQRTFERAQYEVAPLPPMQQDQKIQVRPAISFDVERLVWIINDAYSIRTIRKSWKRYLDKKKQLLLSSQPPPLQPQIEPFRVRGDRETAQNMRNRLQSEDQDVWVAHIGNEIAGTVVLQRLSSTKAEFGPLAVAYEHQHKGVAAVLVKLAEEKAKEQGATLMELLSINHRSDMTLMYRRLGYKETGETRAYYRKETTIKDAHFIVFAKALV